MKRNLFLSILFVLVAFGSAAALTKEPFSLPGPDAVGSIMAESRCGVAPERGPCKALFERYYYSAKDRKCLPFFWGGCGGVVPFETLDECKKICEPPETLRIKELQTLNDLYAIVSLEFPKGWKISAFQILVDGKEINAKPQSGGFSGDRQIESLLFFPGKPGTKQISVLGEMEDKTMEITGSLAWNPRPFAAVLNYVGDRMLVVAGGAKVRLITANMSDVVIKFNGEPTKVEMVGNHATLWSFEPLWRPGLNTVFVEGKGADGSQLRKSYTFVHSAGTIEQGQTVLLNYGVEASKSGPFYSVSIEGNALLAGKDLAVASCVLDGEGWVGRETRLVRELKAVKSGQAKVKIFEKRHFLQEKGLKEEIIITVLPAGK